MVDVALAQGAGGGGGAPFLVNILPIVLVLGVFYFLIIQPQRQQAKKHQEMLDNLRRNDEVMTAGGLYGKVTELRDKIVVVEIAPNVKVRVSRPQISNVVTQPSGGNGESGKKKS